MQNRPFLAGVCARPTVPTDAVGVPFRKTNKALTLLIGLVCT